MKTSVASVTFRGRSIAEVASLAHRAGLDAIEWGGDLHVPPKDNAAARLALSCMRTYGLRASAYGSYYRTGAKEAFEPVLQTALLLGCRVIRVWAGSCASADCTADERAAIAARLAAAVRLAAQAGCAVATEYHANTLTDTLDSARSLLDEVPGLRTLWQPPVGLPLNENLRALHALAGRMENLHVYHRNARGDCRPLAEGAAAWRSYFAAVPPAGSARYATLEFVKDGSEEQFLQDAALLRILLKGYGED